MTAPAPPVESLPHAATPEAVLRAAGLSPDNWAATPGETFAPHRHPRAKRLFVLEGAISITGGFGRFDLGRGDGVRIAAGTEHSAVAGDSGVRCVEAFE